MLTSIGIENFRSLKKAEVRKLKRLNIVTGRNGGGKTSFLEAVFLNCAAANSSLIFSIANFRGDKIIQLESDRVFRSCFNDLEENKHIHIYGEERRQARTRSRSLRIEAQTKLQTSAGLSSQELFISGVKFRFSGPSGEAVSELSLAIPNIQADQLSAGQVTSPVNLISPSSNSDLIHSQFVSPYVRDVEKEVHDQLAKAIKEKQLPGILEMVSIVQKGVENVTPITEWGQEHVYVDTGLKKLMPITVLGSGFFHILRIALAINEVQSGVLIIDELEDGLHYSILPKVAKLIYRALENKNRQIFIATHSSELIDVFLKSAQEIGFDDLCLINMAGSSEGVSTRYFDSEELQYGLDIDAEFR